MRTISKKQLRYLIPLHLITFLKKEKVLCAFINNFNISESCWAAERLNSNNAISSAFLWASTKESHDFWSGLDIAYSTYYSLLPNLVYTCKYNAEHRVVWQIVVSAKNSFNAMQVIKENSKFPYESKNLIWVPGATCTEENIVITEKWL